MIKTALSTSGPSPLKQRPYTGAWLLCLFGIFLVMMTASALFSLAANLLFGAGTQGAYFATAAVQNILAFGASGLITLRIFNPKPFEFAGLTKRPTLLSILGIVGIYLLATPAMNQLIYYNQQMHLPESMAGIEQTMRDMEQQAADVTSSLLDNPSWGTIIAGVLIVGILTGICEEIFFRGSLQKILCNSFNGHAAVWISAFIFSLLHFQFFGFVPRLLLGAWFGYLLLWSGSLLNGIIGHALNNSIVVVCMWLAARGYDIGNPDGFGVVREGFPVMAVLSATAVALALIFCRKWLFYPRQRNVSNSKES